MGLIKGKNMESSKTMEEDIYWQYFHFAHFFLTLPTNFHHHLTLPSKFTDYMRTTLPEQIVLKVNGLSWNINLKKDGDEIMLHGDEWEEFANAYSLKNGDILVFKYNRKECFEVWLFDTNNSCEKEASYFVTKNVNHDQAHGCNGQEAQEKLSKDFVATSQRDSDYDDHTLRKRRAKSDFGTSVRTRDISDEQDESSSEDILIFKETRTRGKEVLSNVSRKRKRNGEELDETFCEDHLILKDARTCTPKETVNAGVKEVPSSSSWKRKRKAAINTNQSKKTLNIHRIFYKSNRREITENEKETTLQLAREASMSYANSFIVVMRQTGVYKNFFMTIPSEWNPKSKFRKGEEVILKTKANEWVCRISIGSTNTGLQGSSWMNFARENFLEEFDVCLFVPSTSSIKGMYVFDVSIFRVVPEVVPPTLVIHR
ncbi:unnamed protein product [Amaranthus hypochondriacus]